MTLQEELKSIEDRMKAAKTDEEKNMLAQQYGERIKLIKTDTRYTDAGSDALPRDGKTV